MSDYNRTPVGTVYSIEPAYTGGGATRAHENALALQAAIQAAAKADRELIFFHKPKTSAPGWGLTVLVECSEKFLEKIKHLPGYKDNAVVGADLTQREGGGPVPASVVPKPPKGFNA